MFATLDKKRILNDDSLASHGNVARESTPVYPREGESVIFKPDGKGGFKFIGRLTHDQWVGLIEP